MELNHYELKILRYINKYLKRKRCEIISTEVIRQALGDFCEPALDTLYKLGMTACKLISDRNQAALPDYDSWSITPKGRCYLENHRLVTTLTWKERVINWIFGFVSGILVGLISAYFRKTF